MAVESDQISQTDQNRRWYLYVLVFPITSEPFYIGMTSSPAKRLRSHIKNLPKIPKTPKEQTIAELRSLGKRPKLHVLASSLDKAEIAVIENQLARMRPTYTNFAARRARWLPDPHLAQIVREAVELLTIGD